MDPRQITLTVNGETVSGSAEPRMHLADFLRKYAGLPSVRVSCEYGVCGCCSLLLDGQTVRGCLVLAIQAEGRAVTTLEGLAQDSRIADLQAAFLRRNALQCGFCTPAMLITARELLESGTAPSREEVRDHLSGNYCRCTGYHAIVDAVMEVVTAGAGADAGKGEA